MLNKVLVCACLYSVITPAVSSQSVYSQIDERLLLNPDPLQTKKEAEGKIIIYDRVQEHTINEALDNNFARIENMMFINTVNKKDTGELEAEDDCE